MDMQVIFARATAFDAEHELLTHYVEARGIGSMLQLREQDSAAYVAELEAQGSPTDLHYLDALASALLLRLVELRASLSMAFESLDSGTAEDRMVATVLRGRISMRRLADRLSAAGMKVT